MPWAQIAVAVVVSGVIASFSDWFFMGVLFHGRYLIKPEIWRNPPGTNNVRLIILSELIGLIASAALAWLLLMAVPLTYPRALTIAFAAWLVGPVPVLWQNTLWTKMDGLVSVSHAMGWLVLPPHRGARLRVDLGRPCPKAGKRRAAFQGILGIRATSWRFARGSAMTQDVKIAAPPPVAFKGFNRGLALDMFERVIVCAWYGFFAFRFLMAFLATYDVTMLLLVISESTVVAFTLFRRPVTTISMKPLDWLLAMGGTVAPLSVMPMGGHALIPPAVCGLIIVAGLGFQIWAKLTLRRRFGIVAANRGVQASGPYKLVRHPMYAGYTITEIGFLLAHPSVWNLCAYAIAFGFQVSRILVEERYLSQDPAYVELKKTVRYRLIPGVF